MYRTRTAIRSRSQAFRNLGDANKLPIWSGSCDVRSAGPTPAFEDLEWQGFRGICLYGGSGSNNEVKRRIAIFFTSTVVVRIARI